MKQVEFGKGGGFEKASLIGLQGLRHSDVNVSVLCVCVYITCVVDTCVSIYIHTYLGGVYADYNYTNRSLRGPCEVTVGCAHLLF